MTTVAVTILTGTALAATAHADPSPAWTLIGTQAVDPPFGPAAEATVGRNPDGRPEFFTITSGRVWHSWQQLGGGWSGWSDLGGSVTNIAVTNEADGRLRIFALFTDWTLHTVAQQCPNCGWGTWSGDLAAGTSLPSGPLLAGQDATGRLQVFATGRDRRSLYQFSQGTPNGAMGTPRLLWTLSGEIDASGRPATFAHNADGRPELFLPLADGLTYHAWQWADATWSGWTSLGGAVGARVRVVSEADGTLAAYSADTTAWHDNTLHRVAQGCPNCGWGGWATVSGPAPADRRLTDIAVGRNTDGHLDVYATADAPGSTDVGHQPPYTLSRISQGAGGTWGGWSYTGAPAGLQYWPMNPRTGVDAAGHLWLFVSATDGAAIHIYGARQ